MSKICCIVGAGDMSGTELFIPDGSYIIAADAGLRHLNGAGIEPDLIVGDFDSLGERPEGGNVVVHKPEKDDTDMMLSVKEALSRGFDTVIIYGGIGGRLDHTLANLQTLAFVANRNARAYLVGCGNACTVIRNSGIHFEAGMSGTISIFCMGDKALGVDLVGLRYPLTNHTLSCDFPLGVSNEFTGAAATVSVKDGLLAVIWSASGLEPDKYLQIKELL